MLLLILSNYFASISRRCSSFLIIECYSDKQYFKSNCLIIFKSWLANISKKFVKFSHVLLINSIPNSFITRTLIYMNKMHWRMKIKFDGDFVFVWQQMSCIGKTNKITKSMRFSFITMKKKIVAQTDWMPMINRTTIHKRIKWKFIIMLGFVNPHRSVKINMKRILHGLLFIIRFISASCTCTCKIQEKINLQDGMGKKIKFWKSQLS